MTITREVRQIEIFGHSIRVSVRRTGRGTPLLLFNGIGSNLELLQPFIESLGDIETVVFDIPDRCCHIGCSIWRAWPIN
jgi:hypothetical protein